MSRKALRCRGEAGTVTDKGGRCRAWIAARSVASGCLPCSARTRATVVRRVACVRRGRVGRGHLQRICAAAGRGRERRLKRGPGAAVVSPSGPQSAACPATKHRETQALHAQLADAQATIRQQAAELIALRQQLAAQAEQSAHDAAASVEGHNKLQAELTTTRESSASQTSARRPGPTASSARPSASAIPGAMMPARSGQKRDIAQERVCRTEAGGREDGPAADHQVPRSRRPAHCVQPRPPSRRPSAPQACAGAHASIRSTSKSCTPCISDSALLGKLRRDDRRNRRSR